MEKEHSRKNFRPKVAEETQCVAEAEEAVVVVPVVLEVAEVEVVVAIRVAVHVRHPVVAVGVLTSNTQYTIFATESGAGHSLNFIWSITLASILRRQICFFANGRSHLFGVPHKLLADSICEK